MDRPTARALLARTPGLTAEAATALLAAAGGDVASVAAAARGAAGQSLPPAARAYLAGVDERRLEADLEWLGSNQAAIVLATDSAYPPLLRQVAGAPAALYVQGSLALLAAPQLAMVGSRSPTAAGRTTARDFAAYFARAGLAVTSGLALGIDAACHEGALKAGGATLAVLGSGLDRVYPAEHAALAERIRAQGTLISEFPPGTAPIAANFPQRNRIIAALALGTLVVEAAARSGALITARLAADAGREVFAIPGSIHSPVSRGCHQLIRSGAKLVEQADDVLTELRFWFRKNHLRRRARRRPAPTNTAVNWTRSMKCC